MTQSADETIARTSALATRACQWAMELVAMPSVTGTTDEAAFAHRLRDRLAQLPIFARDPDSVWTIPVRGDPLGRSCVAAFLRGTGPRTVVLTGHFDTVHLDDYGALAPLATQPHALREAFLGSPAAPGATATETRARADFAGGAFLPGRGLLDMKSGLAAGLAALEEFAKRPERNGNILFLAVPDEEANSAGARSAAAALPEIASRLQVNLDAAINLDALVDDGDGEAGRAVALGTVGKLLPSALVVGRPVHASDALQALNAGVLAASIAAAVEWAPELTDRTGAEIGSPPTLLGLKDNRAAYDVTTPERVWTYWNVMIHRRSPEDVLANLAAICRQAAGRLKRTLLARAEASGTAIGIVGEVPVLTFDQLRSEVFAADGEAAGRFRALAGDVAARRLDVPEQCRILTEHLWEASRRHGPGVVIGFASWPYLPTQLSGAAGARLEAAVQAVVAARSGQIGLVRYFPGISDMSYLGQVDPAALPVVAANTPAWGFGVDWPEAGRAAGLPMVNAGPWGRDYHTRLERLHVAYAFEVLPQLLLDIISAVLAADASR